MFPIAGRMCGRGKPVFIVAEIGINHNGDLNLAIEMIEAAKDAGADAVKFQKRSPRVSVPPAQWDKPKETPWGPMPYIEYKERLEFDSDQYQEIDIFCKAQRIIWFASVWDTPSVDFMMEFNPPALKIPSAMLTNDALLTYVKETGKPMILSTGMSTLEEIDKAVELLFWRRQVALLHCTSAYPCSNEELNLRCIPMLQKRFLFKREMPIGYSGHEVGLAPTLAAVALGACIVERHFTLNRASWGTDQAASVEPAGFRRLVKDIRNIEKALGDGEKRVYPSERESLAKLRGVSHNGFVAV